MLLFKLTQSGVQPTKGKAQPTQLNKLGTGWSEQQNCSTVMTNVKCFYSSWGRQIALLYPIPAYHHFFTHFYPKAKEISLDTILCHNS